VHCFEIWRRLHGCYSKWHNWLVTLHWAPRATHRRHSQECSRVHYRRGYQMNIMYVWSLRGYVQCSAVAEWSCYMKCRKLRRQLPFWHRKTLKKKKNDFQQQVSFYVPNWRKIRRNWCSIGNIFSNIFGPACDVTSVPGSLLWQAAELSFCIRKPQMSYAICATKNVKLWWKLNFGFWKIQGVNYGDIGHTFILYTD
jgi:hypothetical protein